KTDQPVEDADLKSDSLLDSAWRGQAVQGKGANGARGRTRMYPARPGRAGRGAARAWQGRQWRMDVSGFNQGRNC
ncbi:MAG: hypothetical protein AABZ47_08070, partial [Planctomycetota bacterium]